MVPTASVSEARNKQLDKEELPWPKTGAKTNL